MEGPPLGPGGEDITWPDQVAPRGRKASSTRKIKPQTSNLDVFHDTGVGVFESSPLPRSGSLVPFAMASRASSSRTVVVQVLVAFFLQCKE